MTLKEELQGIKLLLQELRKSRRLVEGKVNLRLSNEARVVALAVGTNYFVLLSRLILELYDCYLIPVF
jgi:hypothetical protein